MTSELLQHALSDPFTLGKWEPLLLRIDSHPFDLQYNILDSFLTFFPTTARYWRKLIFLDLRQQNFDAADEKFGNALYRCPDVELFRLYLHYVNRNHSQKFPSDDSSLEHMDYGHLSENQFKEVSAAFEFALSVVGEDPSSTSIYRDYIRLLESKRYSVAYDEHNRLNLLRAMFHKAISTPLRGGESFWNDYEAFETATSPSECVRYSRAVLKELEGTRMLIDPYWISIPPSYPGSEEQFMRWVNVIDYEKRDPLQDEERAKKRVGLVFDQAVMHIGRHTEIWSMAANYHFGIGNLEKAKNVFILGKELLGGNSLFVLSWVDFLEKSKDLTTAREVFDEFLTRNHSSISFVQYLYFLRRNFGITGNQKSFCTISFHTRSCCSQIESFVNKDDVAARKVFENGFKRFPDESRYILAYADFLSKQHDEANTRNLFKRALVKNKSPEVLSAYVKFELLLGHVDKVRSAEVETGLASEMSLYPLAKRSKEGLEWPTIPEEVLLLQNVAKQEFVGNTLNQFYSMSTDGDLIANIVPAEGFKPDKRALTSRTIDRPGLTVSTMKILNLFPDVRCNLNPDEILNALIDAKIPQVAGVPDQEEETEGTFEVTEEVGVKRKSSQDIFGKRMKRKQKSRV
ncbi:hypothetical protein GEMRC1_006786 [Eukaryota sp. GEM-RC1]